MKKSVLFFLLSFSMLSCLKTNNIHNKTIVYERYLKDTLVGFTIREYSFILDTIKEKVTYIDKYGNAFKNKQVHKYVKKNRGLFYVYNNKKTEKLFPYLLKTRIDSCYESTNLFSNKLKICYKGKADTKDYSNLYKLSYNEQNIDGIFMNIYLSSDYTLVIKDSIIALPFDKEIRINNNKKKMKILNFIKK